MSFQGKKVLITGSSRGIGRGIALKLAEKGARVAVHYYRNRGAAEETLGKIRKLGSDGFLVQADVCRAEEVRRIFEQVRSEFGSLDIFVSNARTEAATFYEAPMDITLDKWDTAMDSQAKAFLVAAREAAAMICSEEASWITGQLIDVDGGAALVDAHLPLEFQGIAKSRAAGTV